MQVKLWLAAGFLALLSLPAGLALADGGPHGGYTATTDACAGCHRAHTAQNAKLLKDDAVPGLCYSCHGVSGTGADTNVQTGIYLERDSVTESPAEGDASRGLKGGGFEQALMDTALNDTAVATYTTSSHLVDGSTGTLWGNGDFGSGMGDAIPLSCVSCHDPHGRAGTGGVATYRLLRTVPISSGATSIVTATVTEQTVKWYTVVSSTNRYRGDNYRTNYATDFGARIAAWCTQCHTRYMATSYGATDTGDPIFAYRHNSGFSTSSSRPYRAGCLTCHVAHGSTARMGAYSGSVPWPGGATAPRGDNRLFLLRADNRGVCRLCHTF